MREAELLTALACHDSGVQIHLDSKRVTVGTIYCPQLKGLGKTLFEAAFDLAKQMYRHPDCPEDVQTALDAYDKHTEIFLL